VYFPVLFISVGISQAIGCQDRFRSDVNCVGWGN